MNAITKIEDPVLPPKIVAATIGLHRATIYEMVREGRFPSPIQLTDTRIGWRRSTIDAWLASRVRA